MDNTLYGLLASSFGTQVPDESLLGPAFKEFADEQQALWQNNFERIRDEFERLGGFYLPASRVALNYAVAMQELKSRYINTVMGRKANKVPLIINQANIDELITSSPASVFAALATEIYGWIQETSMQVNGSMYELDVGGNDIIAIERTNYLLAKADRFNLSETNIAALLTEIERRAVSLEHLEENYKKVLQEQSSAFESATAEKTKNAGAQWEERFESFRAAKDEERKIKKPVELWAAAASKHRSTFRWGILALVVVFIASSFAVFNGLGPLMRNIGLFNASGDKPESFTPASTLTLATLIALLTAAGFILKVAGRVITNSLTLAEDAEIRSALADTYLGLTAEEGGATTESRDKARTVMLAALFRPLPGHQQEEITAPTVLTLAQEMLAKKGGS